MLNPIGFEAEVDGPLVDLASLTGEPTEALVRSLRSAVGVRAPSLDRPEAARLVAGLAMAGVPITADSVAHDVVRCSVPPSPPRSPHPST